VNAIINRLYDATILSGDPSVDRLVRMQCANGYIDVSAGSSVVCLLESGASVEIADDGRSMCLESTARCSGTFQVCDGYQGAVHALLACAGWGA
jgi:hypothetical protein